MARTQNGNCRKKYYGCSFNLTRPIAFSIHERFFDEPTKLLTYESVFGNPSALECVYLKYHYDVLRSVERVHRYPLKPVGFRSARKPRRANGGAAGSVNKLLALWYGTATTGLYRRSVLISLHAYYASIRTHILPRTDVNYKCPAR